MGDKDSLELLEAERDGERRAREHVEERCATLLRERDKYCERVKELERLGRSVVDVAEHHGDVADLVLAIAPLAVALTQSVDEGE